ncbi:helix-turn-helix domain-containing protein [Candidatus Poribacteria bacterium]|nr:helix-turn-helix domain-containing protein [Candidatus Poribacteria bacterium]
MPGPLPKYTIILTEDQKKELIHITRSYTFPHWQVQRSQILLIAFRQPGLSNTRISKEINASLTTVKYWRRKWCEDGTLKDSPRHGSPREFSPSVRAQIIALACSNLLLVYYIILPLPHRQAINCLTTSFGNFLHQKPPACKYETGRLPVVQKPKHY